MFGPVQPSECCDLQGLWGEPWQVYNLLSLGGTAELLQAEPAGKAVTPGQCWHGAAEAAEVLAGLQRLCALWLRT